MKLPALPIERPPLIATLAIATLNDGLAATLTNEVAETLRAVFLDLVGHGRWWGAQLLHCRQDARRCRAKPG